MISLIHPSRARPRKATETAQRWIERAGQKVQHIFSLDEDDGHWGEYPMIDIVLVNDNSNAVQAINRAAKEAYGDILVVVSDDFDCPENWANEIEKFVGKRMDWILKTQDGTQGWIITLPIMDRVYFNRFGYIYFPGYQHMFCDTEMTCVAELTGRKLTSDLLFKHNHYSVTKGERDAVSVKADATWAQGERLFLDRYKSNFGVTDIKGRITDASYLNWIKKKL